MNKQKLASLKEKIKKNAPLIITMTTFVTAAAIAALKAKKLLDEVSTVEGFVLAEVTGEERETLMKDENYVLLHIDGDEYMFARKTLED